MFSVDGQFLGIEGVLRFESCGHFVPGGRVEPVSLANLMDDIEDNSRDWEPTEEFDPDTVEVED
jgi:hypothetical protein